MGRKGSFVLEKEEHWKEELACRNVHGGGMWYE